MLAPIRVTEGHIMSSGRRCGDVAQPTVGFFLVDKYNILLYCGDHTLVTATLVEGSQLRAKRSWVRFPAADICTLGGGLWPGRGLYPAVDVFQLLVDDDDDILCEVI
uniref:SFRICE_027490 n=1 Tax=Spodoptera frugiperda TaxID=7108 RepID=A0A2H1WUV4_SPOFR